MVLPMISYRLIIAKCFVISGESFRGRETVCLPRSQDILNDFVHKVNKINILHWGCRRFVSPEERGMREIIKNRALELGFCAVGVTSADPVEEISGLEGAISSGRIAGMSWLARNPAMRCDPKSLLKSAKSVICLAYPYGENGVVAADDEQGGVPSGLREDESGNPFQKVARFARGVEYHAFIRKKLEEITAEIEKRNPGADFKICVDTSPILEKALAARAGIGWIGKNTLLINERFGSWILLGEIMTDIEIPTDHPVADLCGECDLCIRSCPTFALLEPRRLDARNCLSYLSIEREVRAGGWFSELLKGRYGCDLCQELCPYNSRKSTGC